MSWRLRRLERTAVARGYGGQRAEVPAFIAGKSHYYPFGMNHLGPWYETVAPENKYLYNGKELNGDYEINLMDYGARWYDGAIGRWTAVDPSAENYYSISPYAYTANNPLRYIDPLGTDIVEHENGTTFTGGHARAAFMALQSTFEDQPERNETETDPPRHAFAQLMLRGTATQMLAGFTGSVAFGVAVSYDDESGWEYGVYVSGSAGLAAGTPGGVGGFELGGGIGNLDNFGGWGISFGDYSKFVSLDATIPRGGGPEDVTITGNPFPSKQISSGLAVFVEPTYTHFLKRSGQASDIIDYLGNSLPSSISSERRNSLISQIDVLKERLLPSPRP